MIKANELMIGNWIHFECENLCMTTRGSVNYIKQDGVYKNKESYGQPIYMVGLIDQWGQQREEHIIDLEPIELTPDILIEWCGFTEWGDTLQYEGFVDYWKCSFNADYNDWDIYYAYDKDVTGQVIASKKYLHQLQNLFFSLTETELEINLIKQ